MNPRLSMELTSWIISYHDYRRRTKNQDSVILIGIDKKFAIYGWLQMLSLLSYVWNIN